MAERVAKDIDVLINSSGRVTFNPPLESALRTNVEGTKNVIAFAKRMKRPALIHTSTCFVAGNRSGEVWEDEELDGYFPRHERAAGDAVLGRAGDRRQRARARRASASWPTTPRCWRALRQQARDRLREENRDPDDEQALKLAVARSRKEWIRVRDDQAGGRAGGGSGAGPTSTRTRRAWATSWWRARPASCAPSSARRSSRARSRIPFRGWNEGFTTSAPLVYLALKGQNVLPVSPKLILDVVPVDHVVRGRC